MHIISARTDYEPRYPGDTTKWKLHAFKHVKQNFDQNIIANIICMGDSHIEIDAAYIMGK